MAHFGRARDLLRGFKGEGYVHGMGVLWRVGASAAAVGRSALLVRTSFPGGEGYLQTVRDALASAGVRLLAEVEGPAPNAPIEDLVRVTAELSAHWPDVVVSFGGGSTIDVAKAAIALNVLDGDIEALFGTGLVSDALAAQGKHLTPHVAIQTAASSAAHLTKYANITNLETQQKKLIVDDAIIPQQPIFDYTVTFAAPPALTADGAVDGLSHALEVLYGAVGKPGYEQVEDVAREAIGLIVQYLPRVMAGPSDAEGREALGLATDLGGYAIMLGGTNGAHLTSFSLVDVMPHGRACFLMNPYYTVLFAPAIQRPLAVVGRIFQDAGYLVEDIDALKGRALAEAVARAMIAFGAAIGLPTTLRAVERFTDAHVPRALTAAKNPQLRMKLENMPVPLTPDMVDVTMGSVLAAALDGDLSKVKSV
ncbi:MAG: iron-containing alcohol dehydrogenase [Anaerolineae bacterium]|nr:iron-containing alcohol dehydrogenase [Anaerolineae bacterium]